MDSKGANKYSNYSVYFPLELLNSMNWFSQQKSSESYPKVMA